MSASLHKRHVFSIPPGVAFLPAFAEALLAGRIIRDFPDKDDPFALSHARIFVPTRRAARALAGELARLIGRPAVLLPNIIPLGAMDESETASLFSADAPAFERPDVVSEVERRLVLAKLILAWSRSLRQAIRFVDNGQTVTDPDEALLVTSSPAQAYHLAGDLGSLIDEMTIEGIDPRRLNFVLPEGLDRYWGITLEFLKIAFEQWPNHLSEKGLEDRAVRQAALIEAEIAHLASGPVSGPQIVIGSTGSNIATARLIAAIAALPQGAVVLPGLDTVLDDEGWNAVSGASRDGGAQHSATGHPQAALRRLLDVIGISRADVVEIGAPPYDIAQRMDLLREALRPAETTDHWLAWKSSDAGAAAGAALGKVTLIEAEDERAEALAIAIALRRTLEDPGATAALVTPDRDLARRVRAELERWKIEADDSGGDPLAGEAAGILARLVLQCAQKNAGSAAVLALLDHAAVRLGYDASTFARMRALAEIAVLRGISWNMDDPAKSLEAAQNAAADPHAHKAKRDIPNEDWLELSSLFARLQAALLPLRQLSGEQPLTAWFEAHAKALEWLKALPPEEEAPPPGEDEQTLQALFETFLSARSTPFPVALEAYTSLFASVAEEAIVRGPRRTHPRLKILGLLEARLMNPDVMILGGLDETIWPPAARTDAFLNRPMRAELGLSAPERRIGQTAHDFVEAMGAREVILTRARKRGGAPAVPSRFLQRIAALAGNEVWEHCRARGGELLRLAHLIDDTEGAPMPVKRPEPRPPLVLRPKGLSITQIETWRRDPYSIYAQHILGLEPLDELDAEDGAAELGTHLHDVLAAFHALYPGGPLPPEAGAELQAIAQNKFASQLADPDFRTFKWPGYQSSLQAFIAWDSQRRTDNIRIEAEQSGTLNIPMADGSTFSLRGRADRFEIAGDGSVCIVDYKTGSIPTHLQINAGFAPQLTLEAAMIERGAFQCIRPGAQVTGALYVSIGKGEDQIIPREVGNKDKAFSTLVAEHFAGLLQLANQFRNPKTPYLPRPLPQYVNRYGQYDHLARVKEWSADQGGEGS